MIGAAKSPEDKCDQPPLPPAPHAPADPPNYTAPSNVEVVSVKLPVFWPDQVDVWFCQCEAQFALAGIKNESTKFYHVIAQLEQRYANEVKDIIKKPPAERQYTVLKQELTKRLTGSREQQVRQLLLHEDLGDRKPSQFLRHLRTLAAEGVSDDFLRSLWSSRLPTHVQAIIASQSSRSLEELADLADKICEVAPGPSHQVAAASVAHLEGMFEKLQQLITTQITQQIAQLSIANNSRTSREHSRAGPRAASRGRRRSRSRTPGMCWYHSIFGDKANKCTSPCNFKANNNAGNRGDSL